MAVAGRQDNGSGREAGTMAAAGTATRRDGGDKTTVVLGTCDSGCRDNNRAGGGGGLGGEDDGSGRTAHRQQ
jgi:hypothetical protein